MFYLSNYPKPAEVSLFLSFLEGAALPPEDLLEPLLLLDDRDEDLLDDDCHREQLVLNSF